MANISAHHKLSHIKELLKDSNSCINEITSSIILTLHPINSKDVVKGIRNELNSMIQTYVMDFGGILLAYDSIKVTCRNGWFFDTNPYMHLNIDGHFYIFAPKVGSRLKGTVVKKSKNHVGCLVHGIFNTSASIPDSIKREDWCGSRLSEGDTLEMIITELNFNSNVPYLRGNIEPDSIVKLSSSESVPNASISKYCFGEDDSGISCTDKSIEDTPLTKKKKKKRFENNMVETPQTPASVSSNSLENTPKSTDKIKKKSRKSEINSLNLIANTTVTENENEDKSKKNKRKSDKNKCSKKRENVVENDENISIMSPTLDNEINQTPKKKKKKDKRHSSFSFSNLSHVETDASPKNKKHVKIEKESQSDIDTTPRATFFYNSLENTPKSTGKINKKSRKSETNSLNVIDSTTVTENENENQDTSKKNRRKSDKNKCFKKRENVVENDENISIMSPTLDNEINQTPKKKKKKDKRNSNFSFSNLSHVETDASPKTKKHVIIEKESQSDIDTTPRATFFYNSLENTPKSTGKINKKSRKSETNSLNVIDSTTVTENENENQDTSKKNRRKSDKNKCSKKSENVVENDDPSYTSITLPTLDNEMNQTPKQKKKKDKKNSSFSFSNLSHVEIYASPKTKKHVKIEKESSSDIDTKYTRKHTKKSKEKNKLTTFVKKENEEEMFDSFNESSKLLHMSTKKRKRSSLDNSLEIKQKNKKFKK